MMPEAGIRKPAPERDDIIANHANVKKMTTIQEIKGDLFDVQEDAVLIHACNCQGVWGAGIAKEFKKKYPKAFGIYKAHCDEFKTKDQRKQSTKATEIPQPRGSTTSQILGSCLLIPPSENSGQARKRHWVACLFTSSGYGTSFFGKPGKDSQEDILKNTKMALEDLKRQVNMLNQEANGEETAVGSPGPLFTCRINSGKFGVEWKETKSVVESVFDEAGWTVTVIVGEADGRSLKRNDRTGAF
ncbi:putative ladp-ribose 1 phosphate phosphatase [Phaeomoniella chlamydospora]|uniref:ADP-ribose 1''-phosphate phosphatase n=1 Tax=Phaeomoniella chlamydospora TaxID=158046 RepID=A0A0G2F4K2_PHACM|nr:putative ladp-ribose 1 phosphate phosphatase [Phaeomoniella chlamydospora]